MLIELNKNDLISLVKGTIPSDETRELPFVKDNGFYSWKYDTWTWSDLSRLSEEELFYLYKLIRK